MVTIAASANPSTPPAGAQTTVTGTVTNPAGTGAPTGTVTLVVSHLLLGVRSVSVQLLVTQSLQMPWNPKERRDLC